MVYYALQTLGRQVKGYLPALSLSDIILLG